MATNTLQTRIKSKIDYLANWNNNTTFVPFLGEICIAIIPRNTAATNEQQIGVEVDTTEIGVKGVESNPRINPNSNDPNVNVGLTPYAIGIKVGDGNNNFAALPWIQAIAGDIYAWAKAENPPSASNISVRYNNNNNSNVQAAIAGIESSLGSLVTGDIGADALGAALAQLTSQLSGAEGTLFDSNYTIPANENDTPAALPATLLISKIEQNGLNLSVTGRAIIESDLPNISFSKITEIDYPTGHNYADSSAGVPNPIATQTYVDGKVRTEIQNITNSISGAMSFIGIVRESDLGLDNENQQITIEDGSTLPSIIVREGNTTRTITNLIKGSVILYDTGITNEQNVYVPNMHKEFVWTGTEWKELGDENSFIVKGAVTNNDIVANAGIDQTKIAGSSNNYTDLSTELSAMSSSINGKVDKVAGKGLSTNDFTADLQDKLSLIENGAQVNKIEKVKVNGTELTITNKEVDVDIPIMAIKSNETTGVVTKTPDANRAITFNPIAFTGDAINLTQTLGDYLIFDCGTASSLIDNPS